MDKGVTVSDEPYTDEEREASRVTFHLPSEAPLEAEVPDVPLEP